MQKSRLLQLLISAQTYNYALIDAAKATELTTQLFIYIPEHRNLFEGKEALELEEVAPYIVKLYHNDAFSQWVIEEVYGENAAIFVQSIQDIDTLASHFRKYLHVSRQIPHPDTGEPVIQEGVLAFYDPRVLPIWLEKITPEKKQAFLSPCMNIYYEDIEIKTLLHCYDATGKAKTITLNKGVSIS